MKAPHPALQRVLFAPASGPGIGGGHVMRCLTLGEALARRGVVSIFSVSPSGASLVQRFGEGRFDVRVAEPWAPLSEERFDAVVVDDYALGADEEAALKHHVRLVVAIDDLANRPHRADLLIDPSFRRSPHDYDGLLPDQSQRLVGPDFALVRPQFAKLRDAALGDSVALEPRRVFVSFGLSDIDGVAARCFEAIRRHRPKVQIDLALGSDTQSAPILKAAALTDERFSLHLDASNIAELMAKADMAVGAGGASTWERCCLGLPTLAVIVADNQRAMINAMAADGALLSADPSHDDFDAAFQRGLLALDAYDVRAALRARSALLCDGGGADRIADAMTHL